MPRFGRAPKCPRCNKSVYKAEEKLACGLTWHKACFKCKDCGKRLDSNYRDKDNEIYCVACYGKAFGPKGYGYGGGAGVLQSETVIVKCWKCGKDRGDAKFCPECGAKKQVKPKPASGPTPMKRVKFCPECGAKSTGAKFCGSCGFNLGGGGGGSGPAAPPVKQMQNLSVSRNGRSKSPSGRSKSPARKNSSGLKPRSKSPSGRSKSPRGGGGGAVESKLRDHEDWVFYTGGSLKASKSGNGIGSLKRALPDDKCGFVYFRFFSDNVGNTGGMIKTTFDVILMWKGPSATTMRKVKAQGNLQKALDSITPNKGYIEVLGKRKLTTQAVFDRIRPGSGSKTIQD